MESLPEKGVEQGWVGILGKTIYFLALCINISKTGGEKSKVTIND